MRLRRPGVKLVHGERLRRLVRRDSSNLLKVLGGGVGFASSRKRVLLVARALGGDTRLGLAWLLGALSASHVSVLVDLASVTLEELLG